MWVSSANPDSPDYSELTYSLDAGLPVYAPTPMRGLLDIAAVRGHAGQHRRHALLEGLEGDVGAPAAGDMSVKYFYPLQRGFYLSDEYAEDHGLLDPETGEVRRRKSGSASVCPGWTT